MFGAKAILGLDVSNSSIKVVELKSAGKKWKLIHCGIKQLPPEVVVDRQIKNTEVVSQTIRELLDETGIPHKQTAVATSISGTSVIIKKIQVPNMKELDLEDQIALEAEEYIPFDIEDVSLDFNILARNEENMDVILVACKKDIIEEHQKALTEAGLTGVVMDVDLFAVENAYQKIILGGKPEKGVVVLVNAGATIVNINVLVDGVSHFTRDQFYGTRNLQEDIQMQFGVEPEQAEQIMSGESEAPEGYQQTVLEPFFDQLVTQVTQTLDFYKSTNQEAVIDKLCLSGGCALLSGVEQHLHERTGIPVVILDPIAHMSVARNVEKNMPVRALSPLFMVPIGLAIRGGDA